MTEQEAIAKFMDYLANVKNYSSNTVLSYHKDIQEFLEFIHSEKMAPSLLSIRNNRVCKNYISYLSSSNLASTSISRKLSSLRTFYSYFCKVERMKSNPAALANTPKLPEHDIVILEPNEVAEIIDYAESGEKLTKAQKRYAPLTRLRDVAVLVLLLGTGIRVSECVGLDLTHFDFKNNTFTVIRKGGKENRIYFGEEVKLALFDYLEQRSNITPVEGHENALFLSMQNRRITVRAVENLVKKYASVVTTLKKITPHKLRSTYGTTLYRETGDIYLVADVLGHKDVNTTRKHYAALEEDRRRQAAKVVTLREKRE